MNLAGAINAIMPTSLNKTITFNGTTSMSAVGTISIPSKSFFSVTAVATYYNNRPQSIGLTTDSNWAWSTGIFQTDTSDGVSPAVTYSGYTNSAITLNVFAKYGNTNENKITVTGFYIKKPN